MSLRKIKKGEVNQVTITWLIVIIVVAIAIIFVTKLDLKTIMGNLPGKNINPEDEPDELIEGIDSKIAFFDCKYPVGYVPIEAGRRTIHLLGLDDIKEVELKEVGNHLSKATKKEHLQLTVDGEILYSERSGKWWNLWLWKTESGIAKKENKKENGKPTGESIIKFNQQLIEFTFNSFKNSLPNINNPSINLESLRKELQILYNARYIPNPGWICGDPLVIESLRELEKCEESCEIYGGECKVNGESNEIEIKGIDCEAGKKCFTKFEEKLTTTDFRINEVNFSRDSYDRKFLKEKSLIGVNEISLEDLKKGDYGINISFEGNSKMGCMYLGTKDSRKKGIVYLDNGKNFVIRRGYDNTETNSLLNIDHTMYLDSKEELILSIELPSSNEKIYKVINITALKNSPTDSTINGIKNKIKNLKNGGKLYIEAGGFSYNFKITNNRDKEIYKVDSLNPSGYTLKKLYYLKWDFWRPYVEVEAHFIVDALGRSGISSHTLDCNRRGLLGRGILQRDIENMKEDTLGDLLNNCNW